ncbi:amyloid protein-binding protein 2 [Culicoides brevitarsis]|uniref:amyloid protein-binding protein 2 n=1 Tax=Culicoides brevitarsis TaxID=469753 RepID=UPI00307BC74B
MNHVTSLYNISLQTICHNIKLLQSTCLKSLPPTVLIDLYEMMTEEELWDALFTEMTDLECLVRILRFGSNNRQKLVKVVCRLMEKLNICTTLSWLFEDFEKKNAKNFRTVVDYGILIGGLLSESGWLSDAMNILSKTFSKVKLLLTTNASYETNLLALSCAQKLLYVQSTACCFTEAAITTSDTLEIISRVVSNEQIKVPSALIASFYTQMSVLHYHRSEYTLSYEWSCRALKYLEENSPDKIVIDVLRQAAKACVVKRKFQCANLLIKQAVARARVVFGETHLAYSDALMDYGFFLLNSDSVSQSVKIYRQALEIKVQILGTKNIFVAIAHEDLAYALYVLEYNNGRFDAPLSHISICINIMADLVKDNQLMQASAKRVKALILEEIALDSMPPFPNSLDRKMQPMLRESEQLHLAALSLSLETFGKNNVQTAKHYGNLGRLYQSMNQYEKAEKMHKKAIKIKSDLLGCYDYEVGLSIGHLASLYNFHMDKYDEAEELYLKSIQINLKLFGKAYSGLEYDYRGLMHIYEVTSDFEKWNKYNEIMENWKALRIEVDGSQKPLYDDVDEDRSLEELTRKFFELSKNEENVELA